MTTIQDGLAIRARLQKILDRQRKLAADLEHLMTWLPEKPASSSADAPVADAEQVLDEE